MLEKCWLGSREMAALDRKSTRLNSSHQIISYVVFCLKKKTVTITSNRSDLVAFQQPGLKVEDYARAQVAASVPSDEILLSPNFWIAVLSRLLCELYYA